MAYDARPSEDELVKTLPLLLQEIRHEISTMQQGEPETVRELLNALDTAWVAARRLNLERDSFVMHELWDRMRDNNKLM